MKKPVWLSWSSGKDSAFSLLRLQQSDDLEVVKLLTTVNADHQRVAMHATRLQLLQAQSEALGLPLEIVEIPKDCPNKIYEQKFSRAINKAADENIHAIAFGDLFLQDVRAYRENLFAGGEIQPLFPIWGEDTRALAQQMIDLGFEAYVTCVDVQQLEASFAGRKFDRDFLRDLPDGADACGENGEFHTFVCNAPNFATPIACAPGESVTRERFVFADIVAA